MKKYITIPSALIVWTFCNILYTALVLPKIPILAVYGVYSVTSAIGIYFLIVSDKPKKEKPIFEREQETKLETLFEEAKGKHKPKTIRELKTEYKSETKRLAKEISELKLLKEKIKALEK